MTTKRIQCTFFNISEPKENKGTIDKLLENQKKVLDNKTVDNVEVAGVILRITFLRRNNDDSSYWWTGIIEKLDINEQGEIADLAGNRSIYAAKEDEGPIVNTGFVYYPLTNTFALHKKIGGVNDKNLGIFLRRLLKQTQTIQKGFTKFVLDVLPDLHKIDRLYKATHIKELRYSFVMPEDISYKKSKNRSVVGDLFLANTLGGERMNVTIKANEMNAQQTKNKVKQILSLGSNYLGSLRATTEHNDIEEPLDLLTNKFSDYEDIEIKRGYKETATTIMDTINKIFLKQKTLIQSMYVNKDNK